jgi:putative heme-binding domain-containing protein
MNRVHVQHVVMPSRYLKRNPHLAVADAVQNCPEEMAPEPLKGHGAAARIYPIVEQVTTADSHEGTFTAACGVFVYGGDALPPVYSGNVFACEPTASLVHRDELIPNGSTFVARPSCSRTEFLASTDNWFRPVFLTSGPDGALYICDMYRKTIEHPEYLPQEVRKGTDFESGKGMGRIYRVTADSPKARKPRALATSSVRVLCRELSSENSWASSTAFRLLLERCHNNTTDRAAAIPPLKRVFRRGELHEPALPHLRLLDLFGALDEADLIRGLSHKDAAVREHALQLAEARLPDSRKLLAAVMKMCEDPEPRVRMQCALTLGASREDVVIPPLTGIAIRDAHDSWTRLAVISSAAGREALLLDRLLAEASVNFHRKLDPRASKAHTSDETNISGLFSLCYELGRITGITSSNAHSTSHEIGSPQTFSEARLSALAGIGDGLRSRASDPLGISLLAKFTHALEPRLDQARALCADKAIKTTLRQHAASLLTFGNYGDNRDALLRLLAPTEPNPLQLATVRSLARFSDPQLVPDLLAPERWHVYTPVVREAVLNALLSDTKHLPGALLALEAGTIPISAVDSTRRRQLTSHKDPAIRSRAEALFSLAGASPLSSRVKVFEEWKSVLGLTPSPQNGRAIFKQHCGACHRLDREGVNVGPDLFGIRNQPKEVILLHIIIPEQEIAPGFTAYDVVTRDERTVTGLIVADTPEAVTIRGSLGLEETISRSNIASLTSQNLSLMPQELEKNMTRQDMADLLAFLKGEQPAK